MGHTKYTTLKEESDILCEAYYDRLQVENEEKERLLDEEAEKAKAEREVLGEDEDNDNRKLRKPERMRMVMKNKDEGNELFKGGNLRPAAARYVKALTHCAKFFDLGPEDEEEVVGVKLSLYLNLAMCYIKLENLDAALKQCEEALKLKPDNAKALYRRASVYENKKMYEEALVDAKKALTIQPEDALLQKYVVRVETILRKDKDKQKKKVWRNVQINLLNIEVVNEYNSDKEELQ